VVLGFPRVVSSEVEACKLLQQLHDEIMMVFIICCIMLLFAKQRYKLYRISWMKFVNVDVYIHTYIREIYNAQHGRACSSNRRCGLLLGGNLGMEGTEVE